MYCPRNCLYFTLDQICSRPSAFNLQPQQKNSKMFSLNLELVQSETVPSLPQWVNLCPLGAFTWFRVFQKKTKKGLFLYFSLKRVKYLWAERLFSRYLVQLLLWVAVTIAEFFYWWQPNNTIAICPRMELALNFNSLFKKIDPRCLYAHRFTNRVKWYGERLMGRV